MLILAPARGFLMGAVRGPDFIALQVRDLARSRAFYIDYLGLRLAPASPPGAVLFDTQPILFAVREPLVDLAASSKLGWGVSLWLAADDARTLHDRLSGAGVPITGPLTRGPFGLQFSFADPDGYPVTIHQPDGA
jgi:catechol 2,3-dioxygenase-like lactoylglutathione lyase family enzyme